MPAAATAQFLGDLLDWKRQFATDEWYFAKLQDRLIADLSPAEAFGAIDDLIDYLFSESDDFVRLELLAVLESLARHTNTTQMPPKLDRHWDKLALRMEAIGINGSWQFDGLRRWYRRPREPQK